MKIIKYTVGFFYSLLLRSKDVKIHPLARITPSSHFEGMNKIYRNVAFINSFLGRGSYINNSSFFINTKIGRYCSIGSNVKVITGVHPLSKNVSTHPSFYSIKKQAGFTFANKQLFPEQRFADENERYFLVIENDVWIGANVLILSGVTIKTGAVIASGAIVTKDVEPYTIVGGVPAKKIKSRFSEKEINYLLETEWWEKSLTWLKQNYLMFQNLDSFKSLNENIYSKK